MPGPAAAGPAALALATAALALLDPATAALAALAPAAAAPLLPPRQQLCFATAALDEAAEDHVLGPHCDNPQDSAQPFGTNENLMQFLSNALLAETLAALLESAAGRSANANSPAPRPT